MSDFKGRHFRGEIVLWAVRWYCRYAISYRDLEAMMTERGVAVDHSAIDRRVQRFAPEMEKRLRWLVGEARIVERAFGVGPCVLTEAMAWLQDRLASAET